jgi:hypothetical protein
MKIDILTENVTSLKPTRLDDIVDRLNYLYTPLVIIFFVFLISSHQNLKQPIRCIPKANVPDTQIAYINDYCFITGSFYTKSGGDYIHDNPKVHISYYQVSLMIFK